MVIKRLFTTCWVDAGGEVSTRCGYGDSLDHDTPLFAPCFHRGTTAVMRCSMMGPVLSAPTSPRKPGKGNQ